jgi:hypothetical protein
MVESERGRTTRDYWTVPMRLAFYRDNTAEAIAMS